MTDKLQPLDSATQNDALRYAFLLGWGTRLGLGLLIVCFTGYLTGMVSPRVSFEKLPQVWGLSLHDYLQTTGIPDGWGWLPLAAAGDISNLLGISVLAGCSLPPLLGVARLYFDDRDYVFAGISLAVVAVIVLAASGILTQGH